MTQQSYQFSQSPFYSAVFNSAIFDGPVRIYFAQFQEESALRLYFMMRNHFESEGILQKMSKARDRNIFVLMYPSPDVFEMCFQNVEDQHSLFAVDHFFDSFVVGVPKPIANDEDYQKIVVMLTSLVKSLDYPRPTSISEKTL